MPSVRCRNVVCGAKLNVPTGKDLSRALCPRCKHPLVDDEDFAADLIDNVSAARSDPKVFEPIMDDGGHVPRHVEIKRDEPAKPVPVKRYPALRTIAKVIKVLAWIILIVSVIGSGSIIGLSTASGRDPVTSSFTAAGFFGIGVLAYLYVLASSESIMVFLDIEENTRR